MKQPTGGGSSKWLGCWIIYNLSALHLKLKLTVNALDDFQSVNRLTDTIKCESAPNLNHKRNVITHALLFS